MNCSPGGTAESSPARQCWVGFEKTNQSRQGRLKMSQDVVLGILMLQSHAKAQDCRPGEFSAVPAGLSR